MSKFADKIEKAKEMRGKSGAGQGLIKPAKATVASSRADSGKTIGGVKHTYKKTKVYNLDPDKLDKHHIIIDSTETEVLDQYNILRSQVLELTRGRGWNSIMVTSVGPGEGKTVVAINLALTLARDALQTALLVDCNLRHPTHCEYMGINVTRGLSDHLLDDVPIPELLVNPGLDNITLLPGGKPITGTADVLSSPKVKEMVKELKERYPERYVIYDCPHLLNMPDALVFSSYVDAVLLVVRASKTALSDIRDSLKLLSKRNVLGIVMNGVTT